MSDIQRIFSKTCDRTYFKLMIKLLKIYVGNICWKCFEAFLSVYALHILHLS